MTQQLHTPVEEAHGELSLARIALAEGDVQHAANHLAGAISYAPSLPEVHEMLAALAARCPDGGVGLFPLDEHVFIGTVVARAHLLSPTDPAAALGLLAQATAHEPSRPWADAVWLRRLDVRSLSPDALVQAFVKIMQCLGDPASPEVRAANAVYLDLATRAVAAYPDHAMLHGVAAGIARRIGDPATSVRWGERGWRLAPSKLTAVWYAYALRAAGQLEPGLAVLREAYRTNPLDLDLCADMASWLADADRIDEALALLDGALHTDPSYDCAVHTAQRLRFRRDEDARHLIDLVDFMRANPVESHEHTDLADCCDGREWLGVVARTTEACVNAVRGIPPEQVAGAAPGSMRMSLSALEVPSALALVSRVLPALAVDITAPPPPDMVNPLRPGRTVWWYEGTVAKPTMPPPSEQAVKLLTDLAAPIWPHPVAAYDRALPLGQLPIQDLVALLVYPPARPEHLTDLPHGYWERGAQVFASLGILHCEELGRSGPGDTTAQRALLAEIAYGIEDWTVEAALFALTVAAWVDPTCRDEVRDIVGNRFYAAVRASQHREVTILPSLAQLVRIVPVMPTEVKDLAAEVIADQE
jgi:tetratricopeptide (TPR) repeat protein